jgi:hypothetical protein
MSEANNPKTTPGIVQGVLDDDFEASPNGIMSEANNPFVLQNGQKLLSYHTSSLNSLSIRASHL